MNNENMSIPRYEVMGHGYAGKWCKDSDVADLESKYAKLEADNIKLREFVGDFMHAKECEREDEYWLYEAAWDLRHNDESAKAEGEVMP